MPLYELILITKPGVARFTGQTLRSIGKIAQENQSNVRNATILGDRIMGNYRRSKDNKYYSVGRYVQLLVDANHQNIQNIQKQTKTQIHDVLQVNFHKLKDFYEEIQEEISKDELEQDRQILFEGEIVTNLEKTIEFLKKKPH